MQTEEQGGRAPAFSDSKLKHFEQRLLAERERAVEQMRDSKVFGDSMEAETGELTSWRFHQADQGTETYEREQAFLMASREGRLLWHIDEALRKLYAKPESFGRCEQCAKDIGFERIDAIPYVVRCVDCKQDWEDGQAD